MPGPSGDERRLEEVKSHLIKALVGLLFLDEGEGTTSCTNCKDLQAIVVELKRRFNNLEEKNTDLEHRLIQAKQDGAALLRENKQLRREAKMLESRLTGNSPSSPFTQPEDWWPTPTVKVRDLQREQVDIPLPSTSKALAPRGHELKRSRSFPLLIQKKKCPDRDSI